MVSKLMCCGSFRKNLLEVPKIDFDFDFNFDFANIDVKNHLKTLTESLPTLPSLPQLPQVNLRVPEVSLEFVRKLEVYEYLLRSLQNLILIFQTISFFSINLNSVSLTTQINSTISNFYTFMAQVNHHFFLLTKFLFTNKVYKFNLLSLKDCRNYQL